MGKPAKHTPGPWKVYYALLRPQFPCARIIEVQDDHGNAVVQWAGFDNADRLKKTHLANARLMAGAPDLLSALTKLVNCISDPVGVSVRQHSLAIKSARTAIAKATGKATP
jgi:hypothetical protein